MLIRLGFPHEFVCWIMECLTTVSYSLTLNGGLTKLFEGKRGIRQRDPMSPYLFVIAMEYLQREFSQLALNKDFHFHPRCKRLGVMHVCFADDLFMFCRADLKSIKLLQNAFLKFSRASGLQANPDKSSVYIAGINERMKELILEELGYNEGILPFKYLGVSLAPKKLSNQQCWPLVEKITVMISCWTSKLLSYSGRLQLIKLVILGCSLIGLRYFYYQRRLAR